MSHDASTASSDTTTSTNTGTGTDRSESAEQIRKVAELTSGIKFAMFTTVDADGTFTSRPMAHQDVEFDGDLWFVAARQSRKVTQIGQNPHVSVTLSSSDSWVSINGTAAVVDDRAKLESVWSAQMEAWFPDGPDDSVALIKVDADSAEYWDSPGGRVATALSLVKAKVTGERYDGGENEKVDLGSAESTPA